MDQQSQPTRPATLERQLEGIHLASFGWALACCRQDPDEAREVLQTAYLKALDGRASFHGHSTLRTWFFGVVRRTAAERRRGHALRSLLALRLLDRGPRPEPLRTPEQLTRETEQQQQLHSCLRRLSTRQRELLHLVFYQELTIEQAAAVLELPVGTARTHYARGKARLRRLLTGVGEETWNAKRLASDLCEQRQVNR